ncbi:MAG TPA: hypothetical protein VF149_00500 [Bacillales bacterium]
MKKGKIFVSLLIVMWSLIWTVKPAFAADNVIVGENTVIQPEQTVENVVMYGSNAVIKGTVQNAVIVINGDLDIKESAEIHGLVLVVGGNVEQAPGAKVTENVLAFTFGDHTNFGFLLAAVLLLTSWILRLAMSLLFVILSLAAGLIMKKKLDPFTHNVRRAPGKLIAIGAIASVLLAAIGILLVLSIVGIPVVVMLFILIFVFFFIGLGAVASIVGDHIAGHETRPAWLNLLYGSLSITAAVNFPFLGGLLGLGLIWLSIGLLVLSIYNRIRTKR